MFISGLVTTGNVTSNLCYNGQQHCETRYKKVAPHTNSALTAENFSTLLKHKNRPHTFFNGVRE